MPHQINFLIVEDDELDIQSYIDTIKTLNNDIHPNYEIIPHIRRTKEEGLTAINELKDILDAAFIDLKLQQGQPVDVNEGNDIVAEIYEKLRFPIVVLTNTPGAFNNDFNKSIFLQLKTKTDVQYYDLLNSMVNVYRSGINNILGRKGLIEKMLDDIFWKNISTTLQDWLNIENSEKPLLRYTLTHLQENLEISENGDEFDTVYPIENYIKPSIKEYFFTGDLIREKADALKRFIILTPACDLAPHGEQKRPKAAYVLLSKIEDYNNTPMATYIKKAKQEIKSDEDKAIVDQAENSIFKLITNNSSQQYYFLPDTLSVKGGIINFQKLASIKYNELSNYEKEVTISAQFLKDIIAKFSFYYSRQGSPDFNFKDILNTLIT